MKKSTENWLKLDNAAKIFPSTTGKFDTGVFRFSCQIKDPVDPEALQRATEKTLVKFPHFGYILRSGLFWYYLEPAQIKPQCHEEDRGVCAQLFYKNRRNLLFDVTYYHNRINMEMYHVISDGTGATKFFQQLMCYYIAERYPSPTTIKEAEDIYSPPPIETTTEDSFRKHYKPAKKPKKVKFNNVYYLHSKPTGNYTIIEGLMSSEKVHKLAKKYNTTITILLCALLIMAVRQQMPQRARNKNIVITVPVNLRQYFESETNRNFFGNIRVGYRFGKGHDKLEDVIKSLRESFENALTMDRLNSIITTFMEVEKNPLIKIVPLAMKNFVLKIARRISSRGETLVISNISIIDMPKACLEHIDNMSVYSGTSKMQICVCTCKGLISVGFASCSLKTGVQRGFFRMLSDMGVDDIIVKSNFED